MSGDDDLSHLSLLELYREETRTQTQALSERLLALESGEPDSVALEACMRAAHSLKGAARIVGVPLGVDIAGRMEECFVAAQAGTIALTAAHVDVLLAGVDLLVRVADPHAPPVSSAEIEAFALALTGADGVQAMPASTFAPPPAPPSVVPLREHDGAANEPVGAGAEVHNAVLRLAVDMMVRDNDFTQVNVPVLVREEAMIGTGFFPAGREQTYHVTEDNLFLTGTAEVGLTALHIGQTLSEEQLPMKYTAVSTCFRREAGTYGKDTAGLYRVHQFDKVEQVVICRNDEAESRRWHETMLGFSEQLLHGRHPRSAGRVHVVRGGADAAFFAEPGNPEECRTRLGIPPGVLLFTARRLEPRMGVDVLIEALARVHGDVVLAVAGSGSSQGALDRRVHELGLEARVRVLGRSRDDDIDDLAAADVVIGVGMGVAPDDYPLLRTVAERMGATLCATRKVTDRGWMPRARQVAA